MIFSITAPAHPHATRVAVYPALFLGATKHLYNWLCLLVSQSVGWLVTHLFDDPHVAPIGLLGLVNLILAPYLFGQWPQRANLL